MFWMFGLFIVSCGFTHFMEVVTMSSPLYRLSGLVKVVTASASLATVAALVPLIPRALALRSPEALEKEIADRIGAEESLRQARADLEKRVQERTHDLALANRALQEEISRRKLAHQEREQLLASERRARADAEEANRTKDEFLAILSHELRTPLNAMLGWVHLLRGGKLDGPTTARGLDVLERNTRAQARLIDDLLDVSRIVTGKLLVEARPVELADVAAAAVDAVRPAAAARGVSLNVQLDPAGGPVRGDATRLQQVAWNLLSNAVKFTPAGGRVEVRLLRADSHAELVVSDNGQGISSALLPFVFDRFRQGDSSSTRRHGGLGLGLAIVRHLVELHGGAVTAESAGETRGATFRVRLPILTVQSAPPEIRAEKRESAHGAIAGLRVLVVDDEADAREMLGVVLRQAGAEVTTAACAGEALDLLDRMTFDVLVSDIGMPGEDGYELISRLRARPEERGGLAPALALTASARGEDRLRALAAGFQLHTAKPINPGELLAAVEALAGWSGRGA
jgi:signal transduction histidine kinase/CheY-like chemotaxis protein